MTEDDEIEAYMRAAAAFHRFSVPSQSEAAVCANLKGLREASMLLERWRRTSERPDDPDE